MIRWSLRHSIVAAVACTPLAWPAGAAAQHRAPPPSPAYALERVTVVYPDGRRETGVTIVVRGGLIENMGAGVAIPADAEVLEGDSLYVYPGLVDAQGKAAVAFPEVERGDSVRSWDAPRDLQGMLAHRRVVNYLTQTGPDGKEQRAAGLVAAGIIPSGALAAGLGAAILYRTDVERPWEMVVNDDVGLSMAFQGAQGVYPGTLFAVIAYMRQAFEDARRDGVIREAYARNPSGLGTPGFDPDYAVLRRAMAGQLRVFFAANGAEDIRRVFALSDEYGIKPVIVGGHEAWRVADELVRRQIPVLIDGDFPKPDDWKPPKPDTTVADSAAADTARAAAAPAAPEALDPAAAREKKRLEDIWSNAGRLEAARVTFAITSGGGDGNVLEATRKSIEYGLTESAALAAITSVPATLLGIPQVTRLGAGTPATFVAWSGPIFEEKSEVRYVFVEGGYEKGAGGGGGGAPAVVVTGAWTITMAAGGQEFPFEASLTMDPDGSFRGTATSEVGSASMRGNVSGNRVHFTMSVNAGGQEFEMTGDGTVEGDRMSGSGEGPFGPFSFSGRKHPGGAR
ncbi:MAG TPA: hypothetical protein VGA37_14525 [Gemmatimonadales bacterium]